MFHLFLLATYLIKERWGFTGLPLSEEYLLWIRPVLILFILGLMILFYVAQLFPRIEILNTNLFSFSCSFLGWLFSLAIQSDPIVFISMTGGPINWAAVSLCKRPFGDELRATFDLFIFGEFFFSPILFPDYFENEPYNFTHELGMYFLVRKFSWVGNWI